MATGVKRQLSMVMDLNKCIGCHTCTPACKMQWISPISVVNVWALLMLTVLLCGQAVAAEKCNPLLVMISGAGFVSEGDAMPNLADELEPALVDQGIATISVQNGLFTDGNSIESGLVRNVFDEIRGSGYSPVVVVGHSWGAISALVLADFVRVDLVVTFDAVLRGNLPFPGLARRWINVYTLDSGVWRLGGARDDIDEATENVYVDTDHHDVVGMFNAVHAEIYDSLRCPDGGYYKTGIDYDQQQKICDEIDGVHCSIDWKIRDRCLDQKGLEVRFYSMAKGPEGYSEKLGSFGPFEVNPGGELNRSLACRIGTKVCFGAIPLGSPDGNGWGLWKLDKGCKSCCYHCLSTRNTVTRTTNLTCN